MCVLYDRELRPCPKCGGMVVMVEVPKGPPNIWCTECETVWVPTTEHGAGVTEWWNDASEA